MKDLIEIVLVFFTSFMVTIFLLPQLSHIAYKIGLLDYPNKRKVHNIPKPFGGGLAIIIALSFSSLLFIPLTYLKGFYAGVFMLTIMGLLDDLRGVKARLKLLAQILASIYIIYFSNIILLSFGDLLSYGPVNLGFFAIPMTIFCVVGVINTLNMIDGLDGLAGGVSVIVFTSFAILAYINNQRELIFLSIALISAIIVFLRYNWHPSSLFMGDTGSQLIGFSLAFLSIAITQKDNSLVPPVAPLLILTVPIVDTLTIMIKRVMKGKNPFRADKYHLHHILLRFGLDAKNAVKTILLLSFIFSSLGILGTVYNIPEYYLFLIFSVYFISYFISSFYIKKMFRFKLKLARNRVWGYGKLGEWATKFLHVRDNTNGDRKHVRHDAILPFSYSTDGKEQEYSSTLINIGVGGFSAKLDNFLLKGETMNINLMLPENGKRKKLFATAKVVWTCREEDCYRCGFKLTKIDKAQKDILKGYVAGFD